MIDCEACEAFRSVIGFACPHHTADDEAGARSAAVAKMTPSDTAQVIHKFLNGRSLRMTDGRLIAPRDVKRGRA